MSSKTKRKQDEEATGRERKKQKIQAARTIPVQSGSVASGSGAGVMNTMRGLPSAIDVEKFAESRAFEIEAMEKAMKSTSDASTQRVWQTLPRHLRRRAASHDVRRVPARLREKAKAEMDQQRRKSSKPSLPKAGKNKRIKRTDIFLKRQHDKTWLETHIWHAKRMKMENMWGYRLAVQPTEKAFRPSHRASVQGSIMHDASYFSTLEMKGPESILVSILELISDLQGPGPRAARWLAGSRAFNTCLYKCASYPFDLIGPATILWKPSNAQSKRVPQEQDKATSSQKGNEPAALLASTSAAQAQSDRPRTLWLRIHPTIYDGVAHELQRATSQVLDKFRSSMGEIEVEISDLRGQINAFEIMGPKSSQVIRGALSSASQDDRDEFKQFWSSLANLQSSGSIPRGTIIGFTVNDPRLNFPPKNTAITYKEESHMIFPSGTLARSDIWEQDIRKTLSKPRYKKKDLDERRSKNLVPGTPLTPKRQDNRVPILLIQRSLETPSNESQAIHGWTLLLPAGWSMAFFNSLVFTGTRVGGQRERQTQAYEAGTPFFPRDFPFSPAYQAWARKRKEEEESTWLRKPLAKRVNYQKLGVRSPWSADWDVVFGLHRTEEPRAEPDEEKNPESFIPTQRDAGMVVGTDDGGGDAPLATDVHESGLGLWLFRGIDINKILMKLGGRLDMGPGLLDEINKLRQKKSMEPLNPIIGCDDLLKHALVNVKVIMFKDGVPEDMAAIYSVTDEEASAWEQLLDDNKADLNDNMATGTLQLANKQPSQGDIIGYVTTGHYSMSRGEGFAIGAVPLTRLMELKMQQSRLHPQQIPDKHRLLVKVKNINGMQCRPAQLRVLESGN